MCWVIQALVSKTSNANNAFGFYSHIDGEQRADNSRSPPVANTRKESQSSRSNLEHIQTRIGRHDSLLAHGPIPRVFGIVWAVPIDLNVGVACLVLFALFILRCGLLRDSAP